MKITLDNYQQKAVYTKYKNALIVAAPGSGKTTVIINRVNHLIEDRKAKVGNIIVITFTRAAAENMKTRYKNTFNKNIAPFFGTFHGLFYKILLREGHEINIINDNKCSNIVKGVLGKYFDDVNEDKVKEVVNNISGFKTSGTNIEEFKSSISKDIFIECFNAYENYKKRENLWDFDDLSLNAIQLLKINKQILMKYKNIFKYVLVDEFQDCDELQIEFLRLINGENELFAVGDEDQCIYSFRGSKPQYMVNFCETFKDSKKLYLSINYRSSKNIVSSSKKIILNNKNRNIKKIEEFHNKDGIIRYLTPYNEFMQGEEIANIIGNFKEGQYTDNAILYRTNMEARSLIDTFTRRKIPFILLDKGYNFFNHFISRDIISYLKLAIDIKNKELFLSVINKPFRYISKSNISYVNTYKEDIDPFQILINKEDTPPFQCKKLDELRKEILYLNKISLGSAIQYIISSLGYIDYLREYASKYGQNFEELEDMLEEFKGAAEGFKTITEFLVHVQNVEEEIEKSKGDKNGVILSTIHGVKGMEFKNVYIINCDEETIPHKSSIDENIEEERRLFYVAVTRAIHNLYIFSPKTIRGKFYEPSRFIAEGEFTEESLKVEYGVKKGDSIYHRTYAEGIVKGLKDDKISIKFKDGEERSFSLRVLMENNLIIIMK
ncbi:ATP-dependent helicase [Clostridium sp. NSJ-6]|uniref:DNA 3'-5' helicase n=1 Tax=Clostridium hominis TaxID=2763036 RepID=A0ABR7DFA4_9CLOT|nr:ATP-dependent helicase [Clostridium hominis]MBC5630043.1 ATP-dependent helicase [Clostridium hominis]